MQALQEDLEKGGASLSQKAAVAQAWQGKEALLSM